MGLFKNWKPRTIAGKILKGSTVGVLGAASIATGVGAIAGAVGGAGLLAGAAGGLGTVVRTGGKIGSGVKTVLNKVSAGAAKFVTGQSKENRDIISQVKEEARKAKEQFALVEKLKKAGLSEAEAYARAGISMQAGGDIKNEDPGTGFLAGLRKTGGTDQRTETQTQAPGPGSDNMLVYAGLGLGALFLLPKILK